MIDDPNKQTEDEADDDARDDRKVERAVLTAMHNVTGKASKAERKFTSEVEKCADEDEHGAENEKRAA